MSNLTRQRIVIAAATFALFPASLHTGVSANEGRQLGLTSARNNVVKFTEDQPKWAVTPQLLWDFRLGTETHSSPVVAGGKVFIGTNNGAAYHQRYPANVDRGVLLCISQSNGRLLWQYSEAKLASGKVHDWPDKGICSTPLVEDDRLWIVSNRGNIVCLDADGFRDGNNDGPVICEAHKGTTEADVIWRLDMMNQLGVRQHNMANCSLTSHENILLVCTGNGVDRSHQRVAAPDAPSFVGIDKHSGKVLWSDRSPGHNILHGQWSSPAVATISGVPQAIFAGGDGWLYSFDPRGDGRGGASLLWKFDCNRKASRWGSEDRAHRNNVIATPVVAGNHVYVATGQSPDRENGPGFVWCIDAAKAVGRGDVSVEQVVDATGTPVPHRREIAVNPLEQERVVPNPRSAALWCYSGGDWNHDGKQTFCEQMHRSISSVVVDQGIVIAVDLRGIVHCLDAESGQPLWTCDTMAEVWASPLIVDGRIFIPDNNGSVSIFQQARAPSQAMQFKKNAWQPREKWQFKRPIRSSPTFSGRTMYLATERSLRALKILK